MAQRPHAQAVPSSPLVDTTTGEVDSAWRAFLVGLYNRTGGANGVVAASAADLAAETAARIANDAAMAASIAALAAGGSSSGDSFAAQLAAEQAQRRAADIALQAYIDNKPGVTNGSSAAAGVVGELLVANTPGAAVITATPTDRVTLTLPAGDWDVAGSAIIVPSIANMSFGEAWLSTTANTQTDPGRSAVQSGGAGTLGSVSLNVGPVRFSGAGSITVYLGCRADFPGGTTVTAGGWLRARRVR